MRNSTTMKSAADDAATSVAAAEAIVDRLGHKLAASRSELEALARERRPLTFAAEALDDRNAARRLVALVREEAAARQKISDLDLALEEGRSRLMAAQAAEIAERKPVYNCDRTRRIGGLEIPAGQEFTLLAWPHETTCRSTPRPRRCPGTRLRTLYFCRFCRPASPAPAMARPAPAVDFEQLA